VGAAAVADAVADAAVDAADAAAAAEAAAYHGVVAAPGAKRVDPFGLRDAWVPSTALAVRTEAAYFAPYCTG
jgi:hypothetical protein